MEFYINYDNLEENNKKLIYNSSEYSFDMECSAKEISLDILINNLNLSVDESNSVVQIWGFCPHKSWKKTSFKKPISKKGRLKLSTYLEDGFSYRLNEKEEWDVFINIETGWVCIGNPNPKKFNEVVEFSNGCEVVLNKSNIIALWLKPNGLSELKF